MSLTYEEAVDDMQSMFLEAATPLGVELHWKGVRDQRDPTENPWIQLTVVHATGLQTSLGGKGNRNFERRGTITAAIFIPTGKGLSLAYQLAKPISDAYEGVTSPNGVWFSEVRIEEKDGDGQFEEIHVLAEFMYHEIK